MTLCDNIFGRRRSAFVILVAMERLPHILVVDDHREIRDLLARFLGAQGFRVSTAVDGRAMRKALEEARIDLIVLDRMLPGEDGLALCRQLRASSTIPIIMLTAMGEPVDRTIGLEIGADDYVTKPFSPRELIARVGAVLRRVRPALAGETITVGDLSLDPTAHRVTRRSESIKIGPTEFRLLRHFMEHPGRVFSRGQLLDAVWGSGSDIELRTVDVHIRRLRQAIAVPGAPDPVRTVRSAGYALEGV